MSLLDSIAEWIERKLVKIGLCKEKYAKYPNIDRKIQKEIYNTTFTYEFDPEIDVIINDIIKFKNKITKFTYELCCVKIEFENGTKAKLWIENCWYAFLNIIEITDKDGKNHKKITAKRPSAETMISFLNSYYEYFNIENSKVNPKKSHIDNYYTQKFFNFNQQEKHNDSEGQP